MEFDLKKGTDVLARTPHVLRALLTDIDDSWQTATEGPDTWSPYDIVGHLIHGERTDWIPRARIILEHGTNRVFEPYDRFAQFHESAGKSLTQLLDEFEESRTENLRIVSAWNLDHHQLALQGQHPALGVVTLRQLLSTWVAHDLGHLAQISRVMAKQYREDVGPWRAYLSVMDR